jgi:hypothetical protein
MIPKVKKIWLVKLLYGEKIKNINAIRDDKIRFKFKKSEVFLDTFNTTP